MSVAYPTRPPAISAKITYVFLLWQLEEFYRLLRRQKHRQCPFAYFFNCHQNPHFFYEIIIFMQCNETHSEPAGFFGKLYLLNYREDEKLLAVICVI